MITTEQNKMMHALLAQLNLMSQKGNLILGITNGRTESSRQMTNIEANELLAYLRSQQPALKTSKRSDEKKKADKMRKVMISLAWQMNWTKDVQGKQCCDIEHINRWCQTHGYLKKPFNDYLYAELPKLVTQFKSVYKSYLKAI